MPTDNRSGEMMQQAFGWKFYPHQPNTFVTAVLVFWETEKPKLTWILKHCKELQKHHRFSTEISLHQVYMTSQEQFLGNEHLKHIALKKTPQISNWDMCLFLPSSAFPTRRWSPFLLVTWNGLTAAKLTPNPLQCLQVFYTFLPMYLSQRIFIPDQRHLIV